MKIRKSLCMTACEEVRKLDQSVIIIFVTNVAGLALKGYSVKALDYLLKPIEYQIFDMTMRRAIKLIEREKSEKIQIKQITV